MNLARHRRPAPLAPAAVRPSLRAGYDLVYVYAGHGLTTIQHFLSRRYNDRTDAYGGSAREPGAAAARDPRGHARGGRRARGGRLPDLRRRAARRRRHHRGRDRGGARHCVGELPDLWDFMVGAWEDDSITSRFAGEARAGAVRPRAQGADQQAGGRRRPVHLARHDGADGPRRRARPDRRGPAVDRRPVPAAQDRGGPLEDIRECIGCNICVVGRLHARRRSAAPRTRRMGEEWRRGWHPGADPPEGIRRGGAGRRRRPGGARGGA